MNSLDTFDTAQVESTADTTDSSETTSPQTAIIDSVASVKDVAPTELRVQLQSVVDVDVLETLADHDDVDWALSFEYDGHTVTVDGQGTVVVDGTEFVEAFDV